MAEVRKVNNYELLDEIGSGGMSRVYRGRKEGNDETLAIKVIRIEDVAADYERRLRREPEVQSGLGHENIVRISDWFRVRDELFLVMEFVDGRSMSQLIYKESGSLPFERARGYMRQILRAVNHLHNVGIIHRDIKPSNILVGRDDIVKLADFGIAKFNWQQGQTKTQKGLGTPEYMSPEQARGTEIDHRTDIYSLGITFFEMLTARKPFARDEETPMAYVEVIQDVLTKALPDARTFQPGIPAGAVRLLAKATAKDPGDRFQSASEFLGALEMVEQNDHSPATVVMSDAARAATRPAQTAAPVASAVPPVRPVVRPAVERNNRRTVLWVVLLLLLLGVGGYIGYSYYGNRYRLQPVSELDSTQVFSIVQAVANDYARFGREHNAPGLASLFAVNHVRYFKFQNASRSDIENNLQKTLFDKIAQTNKYDIQLRRAYPVNDSTIESEWLFTYDRLRKDGGIMRGESQDTVRLQRFGNEWLITKQAGKWVHANNVAPPKDTLQVVDTLIRHDTVRRHPDEPPHVVPIDTGDISPTPPVTPPANNGGAVRSPGHPILNQNSPPNSQNGSGTSTPRR